MDRIKVKRKTRVPAGLFNQRLKQHIKFTHFEWIENLERIERRDDLIDTSDKMFAYFVLKMHRDRKLWFRKLSHFSGLFSETPRQRDIVKRKAINFYESIKEYLI